MPDHYFTETPQAEETRMTIQANLNWHTFTFHTSTGVFSKNTIDFGTKTLIETFTTPSIKGDILDLGCGYGPIGIAIAKRYKDRSVTLVDLNERAVDLAQINVRENNIMNATVLQSDRFTELKDKRFAAILTNP